MHILNPNSEENPVNFCCAEKQIISSMHGDSKYLKHEARSNNNQKFSS